MQLFVKRSPLSTTTPHVNTEKNDTSLLNPSWQEKRRDDGTLEVKIMWRMGQLLHLCKRPAGAGWILISWLCHGMSHVAPAVCAEDSGVCLPLSGWLIHSSSSFKPSFLLTLVIIIVCSPAVDSACVCACVYMHVYATSSVRCNNILGECAGCKLLHNILFLQLEDIDSEEKQWHE